ncbi:histidine kinase dimerization/phosphoacceptor domain -containing protein [Psychroserpens jangbogonensis]|uniref:histidine kinase dimerization/phosphoacceptor domain -containing protein n=1 Tax=Psychroserpens jangbogonensis TaxID=1484460 RepID=UPI00068DF199|nr:histidine kinase dimerization/phosphoacceptor domain -containing protein [Psychroserpens jangbogonensis]
MKIPTISFLLAFLFSILGQSQDIIKADEFKTVSIDSCISWMRFNYKSADVVQEVGLQTLKRSQNIEADSTLAQIHEELSKWHAYNGLFSPDSTVHHSEKALEFYNKGTDRNKIADTYEILSRHYVKARKLEKSQEVLFKAITIYEELNDEAGLGSAYRTLGVLYRVMKDYKKSIEYTNKALPFLKKTGNYGLLGMAQFNLIISYGELGEFEKAYEATDYCLELVKQKIPEEVFIPVKAHSYRGEVYVRAKNYKEALKDYIKSWELCIDIIGEERCATYRTEIGQVYLLQKDYTKALEHLSAGVEAYEKKGQATIIQQYEDLSECYANLGDFENAILYKEKANANSTQVLEDKIANLETEAVIKYETGKKNEALASQEAVLKQKGKTQTLIIIIASLLAVLLIALLYFFNKNKKTTRIIKAKNAENVLLLKEIHHRVKNNLELVKSLISLQSADLEDSATKDAMIASQNRVQSMGIIHQKLYQGENLGSIDMKDYFVNLSDGILDTFNAENKVKIECAMDQLELDVDTAVPIGLIVNELITNALKYAFPEDSKGKIEISLSKPNPETLTLKVIDNGIGKVEGSSPKGTGFGSQLIKLLTLQLNGVMEEKHENGTSVLFQFKTKVAA